jgi:cysteine synthase
MVRLRKVVPPHCADIFAKLEWENPTGSMKDRMAYGAITRAEEDGRLQPGDTVVEYSGGSTGASLGLVCSAKGYRLRVISSDAFSQDKLDHMAALGAELTIIRRSKESGLATFLRSGIRCLWTTSCRSAQMMRRTWRGALRERKRSSQERLPGQTSSPRFKWHSAWGQGPRWSRS